MTTSMTPVDRSLAKEGAEVQLVVFTLAALEMALPIQQTREILRVTEMTLMPKAPSFLAGIINLRGRIVPALDLKRRFDMPRLDRTDESRVLVAEWQGQVLGLLVDKIVEVLRVYRGAIEAVPGPFVTVGPEFLEGIVVIGGRRIGLFDLEKIFAFEEIRKP